MTDLTGLGVANPRDVFETSEVKSIRETEERLAQIEAEAEVKVLRETEENRLRSEASRTLATEEERARKKVQRDLEAEDARHKRVEAERMNRFNQKSWKADAIRQADIKAREEAEAEETRRKLEELIDSNTSSDPDLIRDILWVYDRIDAPAVSKAPSHGALSLWEYTRAAPSNRKWFYQLMLPKALAAKEREEKRAEEERRSDQDLGIEEVTRLLREVDKDDPYLEVKRLREENAKLKVKLTGPTKACMEGLSDG